MSFKEEVVYYSGLATDWLAESNARSALSAFRKRGEYRILFYKKISSFLSAGVPIMKILGAIKSQKERKKSPDKDSEYVVVMDILEKINSGEKFSEAIKELIPSQEYLLISAGEKSGDIPGNLKLCMNMIEDSVKIKSTARKALAYPITMAFAIIALFYGLGVKMLPTLESVAPVTDWSVSGQMLHGVATWVVDNIVYLLSFIIIFIVSVWVSLGRLVNDFRVNYLDRVHPWKIYRSVQSTFFLMSMSSLLSSGIKASDSLKFLQESSSPYTKFQIEEMIHRLSSGATASRVISTKFLGEAADDIELYGMAGNFDEALMYTAQLSRIKVLELMDKASSRFGMVMFGLVGATVVWSISSFLSISSSIAMSQAQ